MLQFSNQKQPPKVFYKKVFLKFSQNSQENTCARASFLMKLQASACNFIKKETLAQAFSCEFCGISETSFLQNTSRQRLLSNMSIVYL